MSAGTADGSLSREPLEDLMLAMDVVDTLRHSEGLVSRELNAQARREALVERLRDIYDAQGIAVSDAVLAEGVRALEEERFRYQPPANSLSVRFARMYVTRSTWAKPVFLVFGLLLFLSLAYYLIAVRPDAVERADLPRKLDDAFARIVKVSRSDLATVRAQELLDQARTAMSDDDYDGAQDQYQRLRELRRILEMDYRIRIVTDPNENSGIWRVPAVNSNARNYYLIVEAVSKGGNRERVRVRSEEDGEEHWVKRWGLRVNERTFEGVAADKQDDGIIQGNVIGRKPLGELEPSYDIPTSGGAISEW